MKKKKGSYLRKSRTDIEAEALGEMETLAKHERILDQLAAKNGHQIDQYYREVVSGESIEARPKMQELLEDLYAGRLSHLYVMEIERLGRGNTKDQGIIFEALKHSGVLIVTPIKTYDPNDPYDEEYLEFALFMSRREYKTINRRMNAGKLQAVKEGNYIGTHPPYGYDIWKPDRDTRTLKANEQAEHVRMMFDWFINERLSAGAIGRRLTAMGIPTLHKKLEWGRTTVSEILQNEAYAGYIRWFKRKKSREFINGELKDTKRRYRAEEVLLVEGKHDGIIDREMFREAQKLFDNPPIPKSYNVINPLAGLFKCAKCGRAMAYQNYKNGARPRFVHSKSVMCKVKSAYVDDVMQALIEALQMHLEDFKFKTTDESVKLEQQRKEREIEALKKELAKLIKRRANQFELLEDGTYTKAEFNERRAEVSKQMEEIEGIIENYSTEQVDYSEQVVKFSEVLDSLKNPDIPTKHQNNLLKDILKRIEYSYEDDKPRLKIFSK